VSKFLSALRVEQTSDTANDGRGEWKLTAPLLYKSDLTGDVYIVPVGFSTDFASVPRVPIAFLLCGDTASRPATLHDYLYTAVNGKHPVPDRATADALLREAATAEGVPAWRVWMLWAGVRVGGASHWSKRAALIEAWPR
jgi:hypothetical protein